MQSRQMIFRTTKKTEQVATCVRVKYRKNGDGYDEPIELMALSKKSFIPDGWEPAWRAVDEEKDELEEETNTCSVPVDYEAAGRYRAIKRARDLLSVNSDLNQFWTLTLDPAKINRYSWAEVYEKLKNWLDNNVRRHGLKYVIIPEFHKDGAIHFHGLCNSALKLTYSGVMHNKRKVYNLGSWTLGFSTVMTLRGEDSHDKATNYCLKYMFKPATDADGVYLGRVGGRWYLHGGKLEDPICRYYDIDYEDIPLTGRSLDCGIAVKVLRRSAQGAGNRLENMVEEIEKRCNENELGRRI